MISSGFMNWLNWYCQWDINRNHVTQQWRDMPTETTLMSTYPTYMWWDAHDLTFVHQTRFRISTCGIFALITTNRTCLAGYLMVVLVYGRLDRFSHCCRGTHQFCVFEIPLKSPKNTRQPKVGQSLYVSHSIISSYVLCLWLDKWYSPRYFLVSFTRILKPYTFVWCAYACHYRRASKGTRVWERIDEWQLVITRYLWKPLYARENLSVTSHGVLL